jgi:hypothetical protein
MKRPAFLEGVISSTSSPVAFSTIQPGQLRSVSWAVAPLEPASPLPMQPFTSPPAIRPASLGAPPPSFTPPPPGFEMLASATAPTAAPAQSAPAPTPPPPPPAPTLSPRVEQAINALRAQGELLAQQARSDALEVGMLVARKILEREISTNHEALFALIKSAIRRVGEARSTTVRLHPADLERLDKVEGGRLSLGEVKLEADEALSPGDVMVDTEHHTVDGRLNTRLEECARTLVGEDE